MIEAGYRYVSSVQIANTLSGAMVSTKNTLGIKGII